jgi:hypothetical protein
LGPRVSSSRLAWTRSTCALLHPLHPGSWLDDLQKVRWIMDHGSSFLKDSIGACVGCHIRSTDCKTQTIIIIINIVVVAVAVIIMLLFSLWYYEWIIGMMAGW